MSYYDGCYKKRLGDISIVTDYGTIETRDLTSIWVGRNLLGEYGLCFSDRDHESGLIYWFPNEEPLLRKRDKILRLIGEGYVVIRI